jgi:hypothetical protein
MGKPAGTSKGASAGFLYCLALCAWLNDFLGQNPFFDSVGSIVYPLAEFYECRAFSAGALSLYRSETDLTPFGVLLLGPKFHVHSSPHVVR